MGYRRHFADRCSGCLYLPECVTMANNLLTANQASVETDVSGFNAGAGTPTMSWSSTGGLHGVACAKLTATASDAAIALFGNVSSYVAVVPGQVITASAAIKRLTRTGNAVVYINWYTSGGTNNGAGRILPKACPVGVWTNFQATDIAPASTAYARLLAHTYANTVGDEILFDCFGMYIGSDGTWSMPGQSGWTVSDRERANLLATAPGALPTDTLSDLRLKRYKTATAGLLTIADFENPFIDAIISNEASSDSIYDLRRKYYAQRGGLSGVGQTTDDMMYTTLANGL